jgi:Family of unknown function (DUF6074)
MSAVIVPFPITRRGALVAKQANHAAWMSPAAAEKYLQYQIKVQGDTMRRKGVAEHLIQREITCFETAVRVALHRSLVGGAS